MRKLFSTLPLVAVLASAAVSHATPLTGQFSVMGNLYQTNANTLTFDTTTPITVGAANGLSGTFATMLSAGEQVTANTQTIVYGPYTGGDMFYIGPLTLNLLTFTGNGTTFNGTALLTANGYDPTNANVQFTTQNSSSPTVSVTFSATTNATGLAPVPEPSTLALLGTGVLGAAGAIRRRFSM